MKKVFHSFSTGQTSLLDAPSPSVSPGQVLVKTSCSLLSSGTERMLIEFGKANIVEKVRQQPEKFHQALEKIGNDGIIATYDAIKSKLDQPISLGYCNVGTIIKLGENVSDFSIGERVVCNGSHSEVVAIPHHLCAKIPDSVTDESAVFTILASIALQGIRLAKPTLGETFVVSGLGLIGLLACQLLISNGCRVIGIDLDCEKCDLLESLGIPSYNPSIGDAYSWLLDQTSGNGVDGVLIAATSPSNDPVNLAAKACRKRGRIVLIGVTGLDLQRDLFYKKEISFQVSCSYGPGRYDHSYEQLGNDYPIGFVRWTEQRNFQAILQLLSSQSLTTTKLISHRFAIDDVENAYRLLASSEPSLGILLTYSSGIDCDRQTISLASDHVYPSFSASSCSPCLSVIGSGNYASRVLIPNFSKLSAKFHSIASSSGLGPIYVGRKYKFREASTDIHSTIFSNLSNSIVIATRHDSHASLVKQAFAAGKHVFVEKPLCLNSDELNSIISAYSGKQILMVGFNRRFAPLLIELQHQLTRLSGPKAFVYTCNAGAIPADHWTQSPDKGGGRLLGEACHFVDLLRHLAASPIEDLQLLCAADRKPYPDTFSLQLRFANGSIGTVHYFANGNKAFPKERLEVFADSTVLRLDNFRKLKAWGLPGFRTRRRLSQDKGQVACCAAFLKAIEIGGPSPISVAEIFEVQRWLLKAVNK